MDKTDIIENLLSKPYWLIDVLQMSTDGETW